MYECYANANLKKILVTREKELTQVDKLIEAESFTSRLF